MADTMETLEIEVKHKASGAVTEIDKLADSLLRLNRVLAGTTIPKLEALGKALDKIKRVGNITQQGATTPEIVPEPEKAERTVSIFERIGNAFSSAKSGIRGVVASLGSLSKSSDKATKHTNKLIASIGRVMFYRAIRKVLAEIAKAISEGLKNVYQYSSTVGSVISQTMDSFAGLGLQMKNQLGAAFGELLATVRPIIEAIIQLITKAADVISQFFAIIGGRSTYHKAISSTAKWAETTEAGASAAKEWKNQLMGFDEINRLDAPSDSSGGGGGGGTNIGNWDVSPVTMDFSWLEKYKKATLDWFNDLDFEPLLKSWERLKSVVMDFIGLVDGALYWAYVNILLPLGKWVIEDAAPAAVNALAGALDFLNAILEKLGPAFAKFWDEKLKPIAEWIGSVFVEVLNFLAEEFTKLAEKIRESDSWDSLKEKLDGVDYAFLGFIAILGIVALTLLAINHPILLIIAVLSVLAAHWDEITAFIGEKVEQLKEFFENLGEKWQEHVEKMNEKTEEFREKIETFKNKVSEVFEDIKLVIEIWKDDFSDRIDEVKQFINGIIDFIVGVFTGDWGSAWDGVTSIFDGVADTISGIVDTIIGVIGGVISAVQNAISAVNDFFAAKNSFEYDYSADYSYGFYADGGFPSSGEMFVARENGPEMVGTIGGRTAVANNSDIVTAIQGGVFNAMSAVMSSSGGGSRGRTEFVFNLNGREFARAIYEDQRQVANERGAKLVSG